jgi:hypothetical protein
MPPYPSQDLVTVVVQGLLAKGERSLVRDGNAGLVLDIRRAYQETMRDELTAGASSPTSPSRASCSPPWATKPRHGPRTNRRPVAIVVRAGRKVSVDSLVQGYFTASAKRLRAGHRRPHAARRSHGQLRPQRRKRRFSQ